METWGIIGPRGADHIVDGDHEWLWAHCHRDRCPNNVCRRLSQIYCYPHADMLPTVGELIEQVSVDEPASTPIA